MHGKDVIVNFIFMNLDLIDWPIPIVLGNISAGEKLQSLAK